MRRPSDHRRPCDTSNMSRRVSEIAPLAPRWTTVASHAGGEIKLRQRRSRHTDQRRQRHTEGQLNRVMEQGEQWANQIGERAGELGISVGVAESLTGGLVVQALAKASGASEWLRGGLVAYARSVKHDVLDVTASSV